jgi:glucosamine-6-phosphate deaminase
VIVVSAEEFGAAAAVRFLGLLADFEREPVVGLATGRTPIPLYEALRRGAGVPPMRAFAIDEWLAPPDHRCSNRSFFEQHWDPIHGSRPVLCPDPAAANPALEIERFTSALEQAGGFDVVLLGIGGNGHLAFNEPGSLPDSSSRVADLSEATRTAATDCWGPNPPRGGMTLGLREILAARSVLLLAKGPHTASILTRALDGVVGPDCPASFLQHHPAATVVLDDAAAALLQTR